MAVPGLGFPVTFKEGPFFANSTPPPFLLDDGLELRESFKGNGCGEFHAETIQNTKNLLAEEGRVDPRLKQCVRELGSGFGKAIQHELLGPLESCTLPGRWLASKN
jgi:hypothetical protein